MPKKKIVGSGLTRREEPFYSVDEIHGLPWPTIFDELEKTRAKALACLRQQGLPEVPGRYLVGPGTRWRPIEKSDIPKLPDQTEHYRIHWGYWDGDTEVDTPAWLAVELLTKIQQLETAVEEKEWMLALAYVRTIGQLEERFFWKGKHEAAAVKGYERWQHLADSRKTSAKQNATNKSNNIVELANLLKSTQGVHLDASDLSLALSIQQMGNRFSQLGKSTLRDYIARARKSRLLPEASPKNSKRTAER